MDHSVVLQCIILVLVFQYPAHCRKLIQGNVVWRHADRNTEYSYPSDPYNKIWSDLLLSDKGISQEFHFGAFLRSKYGHLVNDRYTSGEVCFRSIDTDRSLISAQAVAAGLYASNHSTVKNIKNSFIPFPVHTSIKSEDWLYKLFQDPQNGCSTYETVIKKILKASDLVKIMGKNYDEFFKALGRKTGLWKPFSFENITLLNDNLQYLRYSGKKLPSWAEEHIMERLDESSGIALGLEFTDYEMKYSKGLAKLRSGIFMENLLHNIGNASKRQGKCSLYGYAVNDKGITALLTSMGAYNWIVPPYVSSVMIDVYENDDHSYSIELWFRNETNHEPHPLHFYDCGSNCSWIKFKTTAKLIATDENTRSLCGLQGRQDCCMYLIPGILLLMSTTLLFFPLFFCLKKLNAPKREMNYNILPLDETDTMREVKSL